MSEILDVWFVTRADNLRLIIFTDPVSDVTTGAPSELPVTPAHRHFRYLSTDPLDQSILYAGAV